jgi:hypothetical protein
MHPKDQDTTRASFRIDDELYLDYQPLEADEVADAPAWRHDTSGFCDSLIRLREISLQSGHILASIRKHHPDIGHYLALLDKKVDILAQLAGTIGLGGDVGPSHQVTIGTEGMSFDSSEPLAVATALRLKLVLFPSHLCLHLQSRVNSCVKQDGGYRVEVQFEQTGETEHETLIRHLLEKQSAALRRERGE